VIHLDRDGPVFVARMDDGENRMNQGWLDAVTAVLDEVEAAPLPKALVTTGSGKFYSNGLDLDWLMTGEVDMESWVAGVEKVFARTLGASYVTVAACNGHTFAAGAMLATAHDFRVMREDRGFFCLPEVDLGIPLTPGMNALMASRIPVVALHEVLVTGKRFGGAEAAAKHIVDEAVAEDNLMPRAIEIAGSLADKAGPTMGVIKGRLYADAIRLLTASEDTPPPG
jgi:enoyl-CoA hydratase/carnithine racemase